ncbi:hypothetical protein VHA01S_031_00440 [Vibrio halioticoli NBRC 102217]|uniref:Uncharacterized protein n=1 Tax=Vibrio halioticoli NBRC 102217 TaxID=1219072 RepID=V5FMF9_9VIBR|nr:YhfX family PLP-dependent enzyme [Vibrio halioticoli]GAD90032.1 hypothetical protein VHA01S_031_00440 [Vibrio halioticoli NBRC 102217]
MFLNALIKQNPQLINAALELHKRGIILPDTYVVDVEQFTKNAMLIKNEADKNNIKLYGMTKQFGRNPYLAKILINLGYEGIVAVDYKEARTLHKAGIKISHVGHLVQPPTAILKELIEEIKPEVITVYTLAKAKAISNVALNAGRVQKILLKFFDEGDHLYVNQESGFPIATLDEVLTEISNMQGIKVEGLTHFPCFLHKNGETGLTPNFHTLIKAKYNIEEIGIQLNQINSPSSTSCETLPILGRFGCTHGEPGHALTGTTPANQEGTTLEKVAMLYLSEVCHDFNGNSYCYGGGYYRRGHLTTAIVTDEYVKVSNDDDSNIDYHLRLHGLFPVGDPVIMAFRTQVFVTRSDVALVEGISEGKPKLVGLYDSLGREV